MCELELSDFTRKAWVVRDIGTERPTVGITVRTPLESTIISTAEGFSLAAVLSGLLSSSSSSLEVNLSSPETDNSGPFSISCCSNLVKTRSEGGPLDRLLELAVTYTCQGS